MQLRQRIKKLESEVEKQNNTCSSEWWHYLRSVKRANCEHPKDMIKISTGGGVNTSRSVRTFFCSYCVFGGTLWKTNLLSVEQAIDLHSTSWQQRQKGEGPEQAFIEQGLLSYFFWDDFEEVSNEVLDNNRHGVFAMIWHLDMLHLAECYKNEHYKKYPRKTKNEY